MKFYIDTNEAPCEICATWAAARNRDDVLCCDRCHAPLTPHAGGKGYVAPQPHHWHLRSVGEGNHGPIPGQECVKEDLCANCYMLAWAEAYPGQPCPVKPPNTAKDDRDLSMFGPEHNYAKAKYERRANGHLIIDGNEAAATMQCVHCSAHWVSVKNSGITRGWCFKCNGPICGAKCQACVPIEQWLENVEHGRPEDFTPIIVGTGYNLKPNPLEMHGCDPTRSMREIQLEQEANTRALREEMEDCMKEKQGDAHVPDPAPISEIGLLRQDIQALVKALAGKA